MHLGGFGWGDLAELQREEKESVACPVVWDAAFTKPLLVESELRFYSV